MAANLFADLEESSHQVRQWREQLIDLQTRCAALTEQASLPNESLGQRLAHGAEFPVAR